MAFFLFLFGFCRRERPDRSQWISGQWPTSKNGISGIAVNIRNMPSCLCWYVNPIKLPIRDLFDILNNDLFLFFFTSMKYPVVHCCASRTIHCNAWASRIIVTARQFGEKSWSNAWKQISWRFATWNTWIFTTINPSDMTNDQFNRLRYIIWWPTKKWLIEYFGIKIFLYTN